MHSWHVSPLSSPGAKRGRTTLVWKAQTPRSPEISCDPEMESASGRLAPLTDPCSNRSTAWLLNKRGCGFGDVGPLSWLVAEPARQRRSAKCHRPSASARVRPAQGWPPFWARSWGAPGVTRFPSQGLAPRALPAARRRSGGGLDSTFKVKVAVRGCPLFSFPCFQGEPVSSHPLHTQPFPGSGWSPGWRWSWSCWGAPLNHPTVQLRTSFVPESRVSAHWCRGGGEEVCTGAATLPPRSVLHTLL